MSGNRYEWWGRMQRAVEAIEAAQAAPAGYALVPVDPTPEMMDALRTGSRKDWPSDELVRVRWAAMLAAAPKVPVQAPAPAHNHTAVMRQALAALESSSPNNNGTGWIKKHHAAKRALQDALAAPCAAVGDGWQPIETAPKDGRKLILFYLNRNGKARTVMASWVTDEEAAETDADGVGLEGGWYERIDNWDEYSQVTIHEGEPSHWMPLPANPSDAGRT